ncbi:MAG: ABC transporter permease subunit [Bacteroidota bacterium]
MKRPYALAIVRKDLKLLRRSRPVMISLISLPVILLVVLPATLVGFAVLAEVLGVQHDLDGILQSFSPEATAPLSGYTTSQKFVYVALTYFMAPLYLILPLLVSVVIAADSFAGEKERQTLEALLYTPTTDWELLLGKVVASWLPAVLVALFGFGFYSITANAVAWPVMKHIFFPNSMWFVLVLWVAPAITGIGIGLTVLLSAWVEGFQEAYQLGNLVVMPMLALFIQEVRGVIAFDLQFVFLLGAGLWLVNAGLLYFGYGFVKRDRLTRSV